ncbi:neuromedin U receptor homolog nmur-2-like [Amphiura filiformis]|uniref:neuromedin U receptor homolog nmur-2-like n=1 Tax=Amphiura filiformis TaxID=82378 RepID=UPI003B216376
MDFSNASIAPEEEMPDNKAPDFPQCSGDRYIDASQWDKWLGEWFLIYFFEYKYFEKLIITVLFPIVLAFGFIGNAGFLFVIARVKEMHTLTNFYLANLAVADLLYVTLTTVTYCIQYALSGGLRNSEIFRSNAQCFIGYGIHYTTLYASLSLVTLVTFERVLAICYPLKHRMVNTKKRTIVLVVISWTVAVAMSAAFGAPVAGLVRKECISWPPGGRWKKFPNIRHECITVHDVYFDPISKLCVPIPFIIVLVINIILYGKIIACLSNRTVTQNKEHAGQSSTNKVRNQVARMVIINGIIFFLCLAPFQYHQLYQLIVLKTKMYLYDGDTEKAILWASRCLLVLNSAVNPYVYGFTNHRYRSAFMKAIGRGKKSNSHPNVKTKTSFISQNIRQ